MLTLQIREVAPATARAAIVRLDLGVHELDYRAGQAVLVGRPGQPVRRPYSLTLAPHETRRQRIVELLVGLDGGQLASDHLGTLSTGARLEIEGPVGSFQFPDAPEERRFLFVAGGTGIAPLRAMLHEALERAEPLQVSVVYSARTAGEFAYDGELKQLAADGRIRLWQTVTREPAEAWTGWRGRIARHHLEEMVQHPATLCFVCGPHALVEEVPRLLEQVGISRDRIKVEDWGWGTSL